MGDGIEENTKMKYFGEKIMSFKKKDSFTILLQFFIQDYSASSSFFFFKKKKAPVANPIAPIVM